MNSTLSYTAAEFLCASNADEIPYITAENLTEVACPGLAEEQTSRLGFLSSSSVRQLTSEKFNIHPITVDTAAGLVKEPVRRNIWNSLIVDLCRDLKLNTQSLPSEYTERILRVYVQANL